MTRFVPLVAALIISLLLAYFLGEGADGLIAFGVAGVLGGWLALIMPPGSERVYWFFVLVTLALFSISVLVLSLNELIVIFPFVLTAGYFVARLTLRITGQRAARAS